MGSKYPVRVLDVCKVSPPSCSPESAAKELSLPFTFFDIVWLRMRPVERIFYYQVPDLTPSSFRSSVLPKLKESLSFTLLHFLPLAGNLVWPSDSPKPFLLYIPGDGVLVTVAESDADFYRLSGDKVREAAESHHYVPELTIEDTVASTIALQITLFPNQGFCIGITAHHAVLDGKTHILFVKAWAHICKHIMQGQEPSLIPALIPFLDRSVVQDPEGMDMAYLNVWLELKLAGIETNTRCLMLFPGQAPLELDRATYEFSREDIKRLREKVLSELDKVPEQDHDQRKPIHLSTFVITYAYAVFCIVKAKGLDSSTKVQFGFAVDCRSRLDPPVPENYFGNCVHGFGIEVESGLFMKENGFALVAEKLSETIVTGFEEGVLTEAKDRLFKYLKSMGQALTQVIGVAGSVRFGVYGVDFGWGRPSKVEVVSVHRTGAVSMADSRDGSGGVEIGLALKKDEMEIFESLFVNGLKDLYR